MKVLTLGAGQDVGKSCVVITMGDKNIMFDCGMHIGYADERRFPDFTLLSKTLNFNEVLDCIIISHFHLDHCGALPYFTEVLGFDGPIYMTYPTQAVIPILLEDYKKILELKYKEKEIFNMSHITGCLNKIIPINMEETLKRDDGIEITPYYAGHVIGAAMFYVKYNDESVVYTGDYSTTADKHLGPAKIDTLRPNLLITESTYGSVIRDCRKIKEREFLQVIQKTIDRGGKVLIPIFALGRAQEICLLLENYWERMRLKTPIYFSGGLAERATEIYKKFISYTNQAVKDKINTRNVFEFKEIQPYNNHALSNTESSIIFASPAMLHSGNSLRIFKELCSDSKNSVILPGYCARGTVGDKILNGEKKLSILNEVVDIKIDVYKIAFSAHTDSFGTLKMIDQCKPENVMLVHGDKKRMIILKDLIEKTFKLKVFYPVNGTLLTVPCDKKIPIKISENLLKSHVNLTKEINDVSICLKLKKDDGKFVVKDIQSFDAEK